MKRRTTGGTGISIYVLRDPRTDRVRYVGQTANTFQRLHSHINLASVHDKHDVIDAKSNWLLDLRMSGLAPEMSIIASVATDEEADIVERRLIEEYRESGAELFNAFSMPAVGGFKSVHISTEAYNALMTYATQTRTPAQAVAECAITDWLADRLLENSPSIGRQSA